METPEQVKDHQPEDEPEVCAAASLHELAGASLTVDEREATLQHGLRAVAALSRELALARGIAWSYEHRLFQYGELGLGVDDQGETAWPAWLVSPVAPYASEQLFHVDPADLLRDDVQLTGPQAEALDPDDDVWLTAAHGQHPADADVEYARVTGIEGGVVTVRIVRIPAG